MIRDDGLSPNFFLIYKRVCRILAINLFTFSFFLLETPYLEEFYISHNYRDWMLEDTGCEDYHSLYLGVEREICLICMRT